MKNTSYSLGLICTVFTRSTKHVYISPPCRTATLSILQVPDLDCRLTTVEVFARNDRLKTNRQRFLLVVVRTMLSFITEYDRNLRFLSHRESFGALEIRKSSVASRVLRYSRDQRKFCHMASPSVLSRSEKVLSHGESFGTLEIRESSVTSRVLRYSRDQGKFCHIGSCRAPFFISIPNSSRSKNLNIALKRCVLARLDS